MSMYDIISFENVEKHFEQIDWNETKLDINIINNIKEKNNFQTKSLDNYFGNYIISSNGRLKSQHFEEYEHVVDENSPLKFVIKRKGEYWMDENYDGIITIHNTYPVKINNLDNLDILEFFVDFKIKFINGDLEAIKLFNVEKF